MKLVLTIVGMLLVLLGGIWALQGANLLGGSFMAGQVQWLVIGLVAIVAGVGMLVWAYRGRGA